MKKETRLLPLYIGFIGIAGLVLILWFTPYGAGVSPDSTVYIGDARNLLSGKFPIDTHFPPLYPLALAAMGLLNNNLVQAARFLSAILFGINLGLVALAVYLSAGRNFLTTTLAILFFASSTSILKIHSYAWSEPLFFALFLTCLILLSTYVIKPTFFSYIGSSLSVGLAIVTRYIGGAFLPAALIIIFLAGRSDQKLGRRLRDTLVWFVLACTPITILSVRNLFTSGEAVDRYLVFHPLSVSYYVQQLGKNAADFIFPISFPSNRIGIAFWGALGISLIVLLIIYFKRHFRNINWHSIGIVVPMICASFSIFYLLFLYSSISLFDASTPVDSRILSPVFVLMIVGIFSTIWTVSQTLKKPIVWWCFLIFLVLFIAIKTPGAIQFMKGVQERGSEYTSLKWEDSESIAFVRSIGTEVKIYSNGADVLGFLTGKEIQYLPKKYSSTTTIANPLYDKEITAMCKDIVENGALLVYFKSLNKAYFPTQEEIQSACHLPVLMSLEDGTVYGTQKTPILKVPH